jgi:hypothetical protein
MVTGTFSLTGALELDGEYSVLYPIGPANSCADTAAGATGLYAVPTPTIDGDQRFRWTAGVRAYGGPGTYELEQLGSVAVEYFATAEADPVRFSSAAGSTAVLEVDDANGGSFTFTELVADGEAPLSGTLTWTCEG